MSISPDDLLYVDVPDCGNCLSGVQAMLYAKWFVGASYVGLRAGILVYQVDGQHERQVKPVKFKGQILYPVKDIFVGE